MENLPIVQIEEVIQWYVKPTSIDVRKFAWLWSSLSLSAKISSFVCGSFQWWKERYILPTVIQYAVPHVTRFIQGNWCSWEEGAMVAMARFCQRHEQLCPSSMKSFLAGPYPSFAALKRQVEAQVSIRTGVCAGWHQEEMFAQYSARVKNFVQGPSARQEEVLSQGDISRLQQRISVVSAALEELRGKLVQCKDSIQHQLTKACALRYECEKEILCLQQKKEDAMAASLEIDTILSTLRGPYMNSSFAYVVCAEKDLAIGQHICAHIEKSVRTLTACLDTKKSVVQQRLQELLRLVDAVPRLSIENMCQGRQKEMVHAAYENIKKYRHSFSKSSGPSLSLRDLEQEVERRTQLARALYQEHRDMMTMKAQAQEMMLAVEKTLTEKENSMLSVLRNEILQFLESAERLPDRKGAFARMVASFQCSGCDVYATHMSSK